MPYHFQYVPPSGPLSGRALEEQTERAFNELGADMDAFEKSAGEALDVAANARSTANEALSTANRAISEAQDVNGIAQEAKNESGAALATVQEARNAVNAAVDAASDAAALAETAQATAEEAKSTADAAQAEGQNAAAKAAEAQRLAQAAMTVQSGDFIIDQSSVNANELISSAKVYAATEIINTPATAPAFLEVMSNSDETSVTQAVWSENTPQQYLRTGTTVWGVNAGQSDFALQALPDDSEAAPVEGTLSVSNNGTAMSAAFTPGGFTANEADGLALSGELRFTLGEGFRGTILCNDMEIVRVTEIDSGETGTEVEAVIINGGMASDKTNIAIIAADYEGDTLVMQISAAWEDRSHSTTWGGWVAGGDGAADAAGLPLGAWLWSPLKKVPFGFLDISKDNGLLSRAAFPQLWETIKDDGNVISESAYQASVSQFGGCGSFSSGDGATTFRLPMIAGLYARAYDPANPDLALGKCLGDAIRNITGRLRVVAYNTATNAALQVGFSEASGAFNKSGSLGTSQGVGGTGANFSVSDFTQYALLNAANSLPTADENRPRTVCQTPIMKVYGAVADAGETNIAALIASTAELTGKLKAAAYTTILTSSGTWIAPYDGYYLFEIQGGGGGGGSHIKTVTTDVGSVFCSGGQAGLCKTYCGYYAEGDMLDAVIGAGGNGGDESSSTAGYDGGATSIAGVSASGGGGGSGILNSPGNYIYFNRVAMGKQAGAPGFAANLERFLGTECYSGRSGIGGGTIFGTGGGVAYACCYSTAGANGGNGGNGVGYGSGGSGGASKNQTARGGSGKQGCVRITYLGV